MRVSLLPWAFLLTVVILASAEAVEEPGTKRIVCCFSFLTRKIPLQFVESYARTNNSCPKPGVIFHTRRGRQICADPKQDWVKNYIQRLDRRSLGLKHSAIPQPRDG
ncbi:regakine-1-like [Sorex araneus]|uniref:regakine-1-like n=1 Tax=Sorex araneus TaxID=42254 RepID=UPI002433E8A0|nr:regakine-1-like [Sorex araneus]